MHDGMQYDPIQGQGQGHEPLKVGNLTILCLAIAAYCYTRCGVVGLCVYLSVCMSVCPLVTFVGPAKMAELIEMPFRMRTRMGQGSWGPDPPWDRAVLRGRSHYRSIIVVSCVIMADHLLSCSKRIIDGMHLILAILHG